MKVLMPAIVCVVAGITLHARPVLEPQPLNTRAAIDELNRTPRVELPARAANLVAQTPAAQRTSMAVALVQSVAVRRSSALIPVVAAVARTATNAAPAVAAAAAAAAPEWAPDIATVALQASPLLTNRILESVEAVAPRSHAALLRIRIGLSGGQPGDHELGRRGHRGHPGDGPGHDRGRGEGNGGHDHGGGEGNEGHDHGGGPHRYDEP